jgi:hypothetical protein
LLGNSKNKGLKGVDAGKGNFSGAEEKMTDNK